MAVTENLEVALTRLNGRLVPLEAQMVTLQEQRQEEQMQRRKESKELNATLLKICIQLNTQKTQTKITWVLLAMVCLWSRCHNIRCRWQPHSSFRCTLERTSPRH